MPIPVIAIDGPAASGKGTVAQQWRRRARLPLSRLAARSTGWLRWPRCAPASRFDEDEPLAKLAAHLDVAFLGGRSCWTART